MRIWRREAVGALLMFCGFTAIHASEGSVQSVVLVTLDGLRTQELFGGLDIEVLKSSLKKDARVEDTVGYARYWASTPEERRLRLMPFFWGTLMKQFGFVYGNAALGSRVKVSNRHRFSYPGYSEILTGEAHDDVINSNDSRRNPYPSVLEFVKNKLGLSINEVAAFASWETINWIAQSHHGSVFINAGYDGYAHPQSLGADISRQQFETLTAWGNERFDFYTFRLAMVHLESYKPRFLYVSFGETDEWAHEKRYGLLLESLHQADERLRELWNYLQHDEHYRGNTLLLITTDHGRGNGPSDWHTHGADIEGAQNIWIALANPKSSKRGEQKEPPVLFQNQIATTLCRFLGLDFSEQNSHAGSPIE